MTAPSTTWSPNRLAARAVAINAVDVADARLLLDMLGLVDGPNGREVLPDDVRPIGMGDLALDSGKEGFEEPITRPARVSTAPAALRNLAPAAPPVRKKTPPMPSMPAPDLTRLTGDPAAPGEAPAGGSYIAAIAVGDMFVDHAYQRPLDEPRVARMAAAWDPRMLGILDVADRGPDAAPRFAIINGQHRFAVASQAGATHLACTVHEGLDVAGEARLMFELDRSTKKLNGFDQWRARRGAGDPTVLTVEAVCAEHGLRVIPDPTDGAMRSYGAAEKLAQLGGRALLDNTIGVLRGAYGTTHTAFQAPLLTGVGQLLHRHPEADPDRLRAALSATRPEQLRATATALREAEGGSLHQLMARAIAGQYNRTPGAGPRLSGGRA